MDGVWYKLSYKLSTTPIYKCLNTKPDLLMKFGQPITKVLEVLHFCKQSPYKVLTHVILHQFTNPLGEEMTK